MSSLPAEENHIILYLLSLLQEGKSYPVIRSSIFAIKYFHRVIGYQDPCNGDLISYILEGIKRLSCHIPKKKTPITPQQLHTLYIQLGGLNMHLLNLRTILICVLSFMGFLRFSEVINLRFSDIILKETHMSIFIEKSKTDIYREGYWLHLSKLQSVLCPLKLFRKYISRANVNELTDKFIFRQISHSKRGYKLKEVDKPISYTTVREILLTELGKMGLNAKQFGLHSLRSGGATAAAKFGVNDRLFQNNEG